MDMGYPFPIYWPLKEDTRHEWWRHMTHISDDDVKNDIYFTKYTCIIHKKRVYNRCKTCKFTHESEQNSKTVQ